LSKERTIVERTFVAPFETRRDAELAVDHLVQEHGVAPTEIFIRAKGEANLAGVRAAGAESRAAMVRRSAARPSPATRSRHRSITLEASPRSFARH